MKQFEITVSYEGFVSKQTGLKSVVQADNVDDALVKAKAIMGDAANWNMHPIFEGEKRVTTGFKAYGMEYQVEVFNTAFRR